MTNPYRSILTMPGTVAFVASGFLARMAHLMTALGTIFLVSSVTGSYTLAGGVSAAYALTYSVVSPQLSRLVDRYQQGRVLVPATAANVAGRAAFLACVALGAPTWTLFLLAAVSGGTMPAIGSLVRARWNGLLRDTPLLHVALSFESVVDESVLVIGPIVVSVLVSSVAPAAGLVMSLVCAGAGMAALAVQRRTEPPLSPAAANGRQSVLSTTGFVPLLVSLAALGAAQSTIDLVVIAFSGQHGAKPLGGWILAVLSVGSVACGLWYGSRTWRRPPEARLVLTLALFTAGTVLLVLAFSIWFLFLAAFLIGLTVAPTMIAGFSVAGRIAPPGRLTEAMAWVTTAVGLGVSVGSTVAGRAVDRWGTGPAFALATGCVAVATLTALAALPRLRHAARAATDQVTESSGG